MLASFLLRKMERRRKLKATAIYLVYGAWIIFFEYFKL